MTENKGQWQTDRLNGKKSKYSIYSRKFWHTLNAIEKNFKNNPDAASLVISITAHLLFFFFISFYVGVPYGTPFGNGEPVGSGDGSIKIDYSPAIQTASKTSETSNSKAYSNLGVTKVLSGKAIAQKAELAFKQNTKKQAVKKLAQVKPDNIAMINDKTIKSIAAPDLSGKIPTRNQNKKTITIPIETGKEIAKKLKTASIEEFETSTAEVTAQKALENEGDIQLTPTNVKVTESDQAVNEAINDKIASLASKPTADFITEDGATASDSSDGNNAAAGISQGDGKGKKSGTGPIGRPDGKQKSGFSFEIVQNSLYDEIPSFLNGPPEITYPKWAQENGVEGQVKLMLEILPNGEVGSVSKIQSPISDKLAQDLIRQAELWRFKPIYKSGKALSGNIVVTVDYALNKG
ncbi:MAG: energy transducer TonB [Candidatus Wallbacteria bacterium]